MERQFLFFVICLLIPFISYNQEVKSIYIEGFSSSNFVCQRPIQVRSYCATTYSWHFLHKTTMKLRCKVCAAAARKPALPIHASSSPVFANQRPICHFLVSVTDIHITPRVTSKSHSRTIKNDYGWMIFIYLDNDAQMTTGGPHAHALVLRTNCLKDISYSRPRASANENSWGSRALWWSGCIAPGHLIITRGNHQHDGKLSLSI